MCIRKFKKKKKSSSNFQVNRNKVWSPNTTSQREFAQINIVLYSLATHLNELKTYIYNYLKLDKL
uniref:Uncharacterized protein n=1 Tax=Glossina austeni TaxID=7395 RepID=A0A1A9VWJ8_GLOAU